jgi:hypothetical protein
MTKEELIEYLLKSKSIIQIKDEYFPVDKKLGIIGGKCMNIPDRFNGVTIKQIYKFFIEDCKIPLKHNGNIVYLLTEETKDALNVLQSIINNPTIDYKVLTEKIRNYYKTVTSPKPLKTFLKEGTWETVYTTKENDSYIDTM